MICVNDLRNSRSADPAGPDFGKVPTHRDKISFRPRYRGSPDVTSRLPIRSIVTVLGLTIGGVVRIHSISTDRLALCPTCGEPMRFDPTHQKGNSELRLFECKRCGLALSAEAALEASELATQ
jgi:hypothetical protein